MNIKSLLLVGLVSLALSACANNGNSALNQDVVATNQGNKANADLIVHGEYVVTMNPAQPIIENGAMAVKDGAIIAVGERGEIDASYIADKVITGEQRILMPGLVNGHTHAAMSLFRGVADDLELMSWLNDYMFPLEGQFVTAEFVKTGTELACWEMIRGGTTTFVDMYFYPATIAEVVDRCGLRAIIASASIDYPSPGFEGWDDSFAAALDFVQTWQGKNPRVIPAFAPHAPYTVVPEHLQQTADAAKKYNAPISIHLAESPTESDIIREKYQTTSIKHIDKSGLLDTWLIGAHMVYPSEEEISMMAGRHVGAIHNPTSNLKLASGIAPVPEMLEAGMLVGLGTDGAASNNDLDLWEEMRLAALIHKQRLGDPTVISAQTALQMATSGGAAAIGLQDKIGQLKAGMQADFIQVSMASPRIEPLFNVVSHLVYVVDSNDVVTTAVAGRVLMEDGKVLSLDGEQIRADVKQVADEISQAIKQRQ